MVNCISTGFYDMIYIDSQYSFLGLRATFQEPFESIFERSSVSRPLLKKLAINGDFYCLCKIKPPNGSPSGTIWEDLGLEQVQEPILVQDRLSDRLRFLSIVTKECRANGPWVRVVEREFASLKSRRPEWNARIIAAASRRKPSQSNDN